MGVAGVAMLGMIYCIYKTIVSAVNFFIWKRKINTIGIVEELKSKNINYENDKKKKIGSVDYTYTIRVNDGGNTYWVDYVETISGNKPSKIVLNSTLPVFVDTDKKVAKSAKDMKDQIWQWPLGFLFCTAMLIVCFIIVGALNS